MRIVPGGLSAFNGMAYGQLDQQTVQFFQHQMSRPSMVVGQYAEQFKAAQQGIYDNFLSEEALKKARLALMYTNEREDLDVIKPFTQLEEFQAAKSEMQKWIMAMPEMAKLYNNQLCDGYSDTFKMDGKIAVGEANYHYRRATDGLVTTNEEGEDELVQYFEDTPPGEDLDIKEQVVIQTTWDIGRIFLKNGQDISNQSGGNL